MLDRRHDMKRRDLLIAVAVAPLVPVPVAAAIQPAVRDDLYGLAPIKTEGGLWYPDPKDDPESSP